MELFNKIQSRLVAEEKLPVAYTAILTANALGGFVSPLKEALLRWAEGESVSGVEAAGTTVKDICDELGVSEFQALCILNAVTLDPDCFEDAVLVLGEDVVDLG